MCALVPSNVVVSELELQSYGTSLFRKKLICREATFNVTSEFSMFVYILVHLLYGNKCLFYGYQDRTISDVYSVFVRNPYW